MNTPYRHKVDPSTLEGWTPFDLRLKKLIDTPLYVPVKLKGIDIRGTTILADFRMQNNSPDALCSLSSQYNEIEFTDDRNGEFLIKIPQTLNTSCVYDVVVRWSDGSVMKLIYGRLEARNPVTGY